MMFSIVSDHLLDLDMVGSLEEDDHEAEGCETGDLAPT